MRILSVDTSSETATVALLDNSTLIDEISLTDQTTHSEKLLPLISSILNKNKLTIRDIDLFVCGVGPGSFTGLRIGIATVKAFAKIKNVPIMSVSTLDSLAFHSFKKDKSKIQNCKYIVSIIDAKNGFVYTGLYKIEDNTISLFEYYAVYNINELIEKCIELKSKVYFCGNASIIFQDMISKKLSKNVILADNEYSIPSAGYLALYAIANNIKKSNYTSLLPMYLRVSQAERLKQNG